MEQMRFQFGCGCSMSSTVMGVGSVYRISMSSENRLTGSSVQMTFPLADLSRREELRNTLRFTARVVVAGLVLLMIGFGAGVWFSHRQPIPESSQTAKAIEDLSDSLRSIQSLSDSVHRVDSLAMAAVLAQRPRTRAATAGISVSGDSITIKRPAARDTAAPEGSTLVPLPDTTTHTVVDPALAEGFRQMQLQLQMDSVALEASQAANVLLRHQVNLLERKDSLHVQREAELSEHAAREYRRGLKTGAKVVAGGAVLIGGAIKLVKLFTG
jgi:hypothetical protein